MPSNKRSKKKYIPKRIITPVGVTKEEQQETIDSLTTGLIRLEMHFKGEHLDHQDVLFLQDILNWSCFIFERLKKENKLIDERNLHNDAVYALVDVMKTREGDLYFFTLDQKKLLMEALDLFAPVFKEALETTPVRTLKELGIIKEYIIRTQTNAKSKPSEPRAKLIDL
jgi:hypothetical protein